MGRPIPQTLAGSCPFCRKGYATQAGLERHMRDLHADPRQTLLDATTLLEHGYADPEHLAETIDVIQDVRRRLALVEALASTALGKAMGRGSGVLPDGRPYEMMKAKDRTAWDHDAWKRDTRARIATAISERFVDPDGPSDSGTYPDVLLLDYTTGEVTTLEHAVQHALHQVQEVHASAAPKLKPLRDLGLVPDDYCTTNPGPWSMKRPDRPTPSTTTQED